MRRLDLYEDSGQVDDGCVGDPHVQESPAPTPALARLRLGPRARTRLPIVRANIDSERTKI